jgi:hypothetical protein
MIRRDKHPAASLLFGVAVIQLLVALFYWSIHGHEFRWADWAFSLNFLVFVALGVWARWVPAAPAAIGFLLYAVYLGAQASLSLDLLRSAWIFKLPVAILLTIALVCAFARCRERSMRARTIVIGIILACGGLCVAAIAACAGFFYFALRTADAALSPKVDALFAAIDDGTFGDTYAAQAAPELREAVTRKEWEQLGLAIKTRLGPLTSKKLVQWNMQQLNADRWADVVYSATFEKGSGEIRTRFKNIDGEWRLVNFRVNSPEFMKDLLTTPCPYCGEPCPASAKFCPKCGKPLADPGKSKPESKKNDLRANDAAAEVAPAR